MNQIAINSMSVNYCWAVKKMLDGKTRYKLVVSYVNYGRRCCLIIKTFEHCRSQQHFERAVTQALAKAIGKLYKAASENIPDFDDIIKHKKTESDEQDDDA